MADTYPRRTEHAGNIPLGEGTIISAITPEKSLVVLAISSLAYVFEKCLSPSIQSIIMIGMKCLSDRLGPVDAERFIVSMNRNAGDYTMARREMLQLLRRRRGSRQLQ